MNNYTKILRDKAISPSIQRIKILEYLDTHRTHPTVDEIFTSLIPVIPTLSKMTIYNTLKLFSTKITFLHIIRPIIIEALLFSIAL